MTTDRALVIYWCIAAASKLNDLKPFLKGFKLKDSCLF